MLFHVIYEMVLLIVDSSKTTQESGRMKNLLDRLDACKSLLFTLGTDISEKRKIHT